MVWRLSDGGAAAALPARRVVVDPGLERRHGRVLPGREACQTQSGYSIRSGVRGSLHSDHRDLPRRFAAT